MVIQACAHPSSCSYVSGPVVGLPHLLSLAVTEITYGTHLLILTHKTGSLVERATLVCVMFNKLSQVFFNYTGQKNAATKVLK